MGSKDDRLFPRGREKRRHGEAAAAAAAAAVAHPICKTQD